MRRIGIGLVLIAAIGLSGCATEPKTDSLAHMGCRTGDTFLPELDLAASGQMTDSGVLQDLNDRVAKQLELGYFDSETESLFRLLTEPVRDRLGNGETPADIDYADLRSRLLSYCAAAEWEMTNG